MAALVTGQAQLDSLIAYAGTKLEGYRCEEMQRRYFERIRPFLTFPASPRSFLVKVEEVQLHCNR